MEFLLSAFGMPIFAAMAVIIESHLSNRTFKHPTTMVFYVSISNALFLPLLLFLGTPTMPSPEVWGCYLILAAIYIGYLYPYYLAMKVIDPSIVAALFALGQVSVPLLSYFWLGDKLDFAQYVGFAVIILSSVALSIKGRKIPKLNRAFYYMVLASLLVAFAEVLKKYTLIEDLSWINLAIFPGAISGMIPLAFLLVKPWRKDIVRNFPPYLKKCRLFVVNEFICFLGMVCGVYALSGLSPVTLISVNATQPIFMLAFAYLLLKKFGVPLMEKISPQVILKKMFCFILIILGVMLVIFE